MVALLHLGRAKRAVVLWKGSAILLLIDACVALVLLGGAEGLVGEICGAASFVSVTTRIVVNQEAALVFGVVVADLGLLCAFLLFRVDARLVLSGDVAAVHFARGTCLARV